MRDFLHMALTKRLGQATSKLLVLFEFFMDFDGSWRVRQGIERAHLLVASFSCDIQSLWSEGPRGEMSSLDNSMCILSLFHVSMPRLTVDLPKTKIKYISPASLEPPNLILEPLSLPRGK